MRMEQDALDPIDPRTAQQLYLGQKDTDCTESTVQGHKYRTNHSIRWCDENDIHNLNDMTGHDLQAFRPSRQNDGDLKTILLNQWRFGIRSSGRSECV